MRIPIDDNTIGYILTIPYTDGSISYSFHKYCDTCSWHQNRELMTYREWKSKFKTTKFSYTDDSNRKDLCELRELAKNFRFKIPNK